MFVYRLLTKVDWLEAEALGRLLPSPLDKKDGYFHLSTREQLLETANRYFLPESEPQVLVFDEQDFSADLIWEAVEHRDGACFPHLYRDSIDLSLLKGRVCLSHQDGAFQLSDDGFLREA